MPIEDISYTTQSSAESNGRYITVYAPDGSYVSRHNNMEECTESAINYAEANGLEGDLVFRFVPPEKHMRLVKKAIVLPAPITQTTTSQSGAGSSVISGNQIGVSAVTPPSGDAPYDLSGLVNNVFEVTWPTAPTTSSTVNVSNSSELESAISGSAVRIVMAPGTYSGSTLSFGGNDIDLVAGDNVNITYTAVSIISKERIRITGGNWGSVASPLRWSIRGGGGNGLTDLLLDDVNLYGRFETLGSGPGGGVPALSRAAFINSTFDGDGFGVYGVDGVFFLTFNTPTEIHDLTLANVKIDNGATGNFANRFQGVKRLMVYQCALNMRPDYPGTVSGFRMGENVDGYHVQDTLIGNRIFGSLGPDGSGARQFGNGWFENVTKYTRGEGTVWATYNSFNPPNDGTVNNCTTYSNTGGSGAFALGTSLVAGPDGNNDILSYSDPAGLPDVSGYGAQR